MSNQLFTWYPAVLRKDPNRPFLIETDPLEIVIFEPGLETNATVQHRRYISQSSRYLIAGSSNPCTSGFFRSNLFFVGADLCVRPPLRSDTK